MFKTRKKQTRLSFQHHLLWPWLCTMSPRAARTLFWRRGSLQTDYFNKTAKLCASAPSSLVVNIFFCAPEFLIVFPAPFSGKLYCYPSTFAIESGYIETQREIVNNPNLFESGIAAAQSGDREKARDLLLRVVEENPHHEDAWVWLCDLVDEPEDRIIALENVLTINPDNDEARVLLETLRSAREEVPGNEARSQSSVFTAIPTEPLKRSAKPRDEISSILAGASSPTTPIKDRRVLMARSRSRLMAVLRALNAADRDTALNILVQMVEEDENNEQAWFLLGHMAPALDDQHIALENVMVLNPENKLAALRLDRIKSLGGEDSFEAGLWQKDEDVLQIVEGFLEVPQEEKKHLEEVEKSLREEALSRPAAGKFQAEKAPDQPSVHEPTLRLLRIALWPTLLFIALAVTQSLLEPLGFTPALIPGILSVCAGSILAAAAGTKPRHPLWIDYFGEMGEKLEKVASWVFGSLGWILAISPFVLFFINAILTIMPYLVLTR